MNKKEGFTLIELLVAMAILVIMVLMVAPLMWSNGVVAVRLPR